MILLYENENDQKHRHTTIEPHAHRSLASLLTAWTNIRPHLTHDSVDILTYTHGLVSSLTPANYSWASMNVIDHIYIGILPRSMHTTIRHSVAHLLPRSNALTITAFLGQGQHRILSACIVIMLKHSHRHTPIYSTR